MANLTNFSEKTYNNLPKAFNFLEDYDESQAKDIALISAVNAISACIPNVYLKKKHKKISLHTYVYVYGGSGAGKSDLEIGEEMIEFVSDYIYNKSLSDIENWKLLSLKEQKEVIQPTECYHSLQQLTSASFFNELNNAGAEGLYVRHFEGDDLLGKMNSEFGVSKNDLLNAYEQVKMTKKLANGYALRIKHPKLALALSTTDVSYYKFASKYMESGFANRFLTYKSERKTKKTADVFQVNSAINKDKLNYGKSRIYKLFRLLNNQNSDITLNFSPQFISAANNFCQKILDEYVPKNKHYYGYAMRLPFNISRFCATISVLAHFDEIIDDLYLPDDDDDNDYDIDVTNIDIKVDNVDVFNSVKNAFFSSAQDTITAISSNKYNRYGDVLAYVDWQSLPNVFKTGDFKNAYCSDIPLHNQKTTRLLKKYADEGLIISKSHGTWEKSKFLKKIN